MSRTASLETVNRGERSCVHPTPKMIDPKKIYNFQQSIRNRVDELKKRGEYDERGQQKQ